MEFWGVEVKAGETLKVSPGEGKVIHLSQAAIGESKKGKDEAVPVHVKVGEQKLVIGTLSADRFPQIQYDVVFEKDFELSHNWKNGSVFFCGYRTQNPEEDDEVYSGDDFDSDSEEEELLIENGKPEPAKVGASKPVSAAKPKVKIEELAKGAVAVSDDDSSDEDDSDDKELSDDDDKMDADDSDVDDSSDEEDEKTPTPKKETKKRPAESASKTPVPSKKAKLATPQKTDGKKNTASHTATPHPAKQPAKTPKSENPKTSASAGKATCNSCSKTFNSEKALDSHSKAKHAAAK